MHLAIKAMRAGRDDEALALLQRAIDRNPKEANAYHLRGAILVANGQPKEAIAEMTQALTLNPDLPGARFQLGLLHFTSGNVFDAQLVWQPFESLDERHPLRLFSKGMLHLARDEFESCIALLEQGISLCTVESINKDMQRVIDKVRSVAPATKAAANTDQLSQDTAQHVMLKRYDKALDDNKGS